ncbi:MAG: hypothetical protein IPP14_09430 [Planctomycetes bacterium]|nr:hypothetical protein [Planctomycetota bacterium]
MRKIAGLVAVLLVAFSLSGCGIPGDEPAKKWVAFLDKHAALVKDGTFKVADFKSEGQPIVDELKKVKDSKDNKIPMSQEVLDEWNRANKGFNEAASAKLNLEAIGAFVALVEDMTGQKIGANAPAN